jgi:hypothetical protein
MNKGICSYCKKTVEVFHSIQYRDLVGVCSDQCERDKRAREKAIEEAKAPNSAYTDFTSAISHVPRRR